MTHKLGLAPATLLCLFFPTGLATAQAAPPAKTSAVANPFPAAFSLAEWGRLAAIQTRLEKTQTLAAPDIDFAAHLLRTPPPQNSSKEQNERQRVVLSELTATRPMILTADQRRHLFDVVLPYTDSPYTIVRTNAMLVLTFSRDPRTIAVLERHAKTDPNPMNRSIAGSFLRRLRAVLGKSATHSGSAH